MEMAVVYLAERGDEKICGNILEISRNMGISKKLAYKKVDRHLKTSDGWRIRRLYKAVWEYTASNPDEDDIVGSAEEIACLTGYTTRFIRWLAEDKRKSSCGWTVTKRLVKKVFDVA